MRKIIIFVIIIGLSIALDYTVDPSFLSAGARTAAMANAFSALSDDYSSIYSNPAGLSKIKSIQLGFMRSNLFGDIFTFNGGVVFPMDGYTIGVAGIYKGAEGIPKAKRDKLSNQIVKTGSTEYKNMLLAVAISKKFEFLNKEVPLIKKAQIGTTLKLFSEDSGSFNKTGNGINSDFGVIVYPSDAFSFSYVYHNFLGTRVKWSTGYESKIESKMTIGGVYELLGNKQDSLIFMKDQKLNVLFDYDIHAQRNNFTTKLGAEYFPFSYLALRAGMNLRERAETATTVKSKIQFSLGMGVNYEGLRFDYAYVLDPEDVKENNTHYFSMLFDIFGPQDDKEYVDHINIEFPADKTITDRGEFILKGIVSPLVDYVKANDKLVRVHEGAFEVDMDLDDKYGKNKIIVLAYNAEREMVDSDNVRILYQASFQDVVNNAENRDIIDLATLGLIKKDIKFRPHDPMKRSEVATTIVRLKKYPIDTNIQEFLFNDINNHSERFYIMAAYNSGFMNGYVDGSFLPTQPINKVEAAVVMVKLDRLTIVPKNRSYSALSEDHWAKRYVDTAIDNGIIDLVIGEEFKLTEPVTRKGIINLLYNTYYVQNKVSDLYNWDSY